MTLTKYLGYGTRTRGLTTPTNPRSRSRATSKWRWGQGLHVTLLWLPSLGKSKIAAPKYGSHQFTANKLDREIRLSIKSAMLLVFAVVHLTRGPVAQYGCLITLH